MSDHDDRIADLEMRLAHQDKTISDLNETVLVQWRRIEALERQISRINAEIQNLDSGPVPVEKPPHY